jgi:hypothetical protein
MSFVSFIDTDDDSRTIRSTPSTPSSSQRKWVANASRSNKSYTAYFFHIDNNNSDITYCKVCEHNLSGSHQKPYPYSRKGGNTSNMIAHLRDKHGIIRNNYTKYLDNNNEVWYYCIIVLLYDMARDWW